MKQSGTALSFPDARIMVYAAPKAACTSVKKTLASAYMEPFDKTARDALHRLKRNERCLDYFRIAFCRNPMEKIRSIYAEKLVQRKAVKPLLRDLGFYKEMPFADYINLVVSITDEKAEKHLKSQHLLLFRDGPPDLLIRFEDLTKGWKRVQKIFKDRCSRNIPDLMWENKTTAEKPALTDQMKTAIAHRYKQDIQMLGY
jgi:hypothetical protein